MTRFTHSKFKRATNQNSRPLSMVDIDRTPTLNFKESK